MANRYYSYSSLLAHYSERGSHLKPSGTMGTHHCTLSLVPEGVKVEGEIRIKARKPHLGRHEYIPGHVVIKPGDTLGYDQGIIWRLPAPSTPLDFLRKKWFMSVVVAEMPIELSRCDDIAVGRASNSAWSKSNLREYTLIYRDGDKGFKTLSGSEIDWKLVDRRNYDTEHILDGRTSYEAKVPNHQNLVGYLVRDEDYDCMRTQSYRISYRLYIKDRKQITYKFLNSWAAEELKRMEVRNASNS